MTIGLQSSNCTRGKPAQSGMQSVAIPELHLESGIRKSRERTKRIEAMAIGSPTGRRDNFPRVGRRNGFAVLFYANVTLPIPSVTCVTPCSFQRQPYQRQNVPTVGCQAALRQEPRTSLHLQWNGNTSAGGCLICSQGTVGYDGRGGTLPTVRSVYSFHLRGPSILQLMFRCDFVAAWP